MQRPAEITTLAAAVAYLVLYALGALEDKTLLVSLTLLIGALPAAVTFLAVTFRRPKP